MRAPFFASTVENLAGRRFTARETADAAGISGDVLTNYLVKARVALSSASPGRGRPREYCLADVYQIALLTDLVRLTRDVEWSARALEAFSFEGEFFVHSAGQDLSDTPWAHWREQKPRHRPDLCAHIGEAHPLFWSRPVSQNWFVLAELDNVVAQHPRLSIIQAGAASFLNFQRLGFFLNVTKRLSQVDTALTASAGETDLDSVIAKATVPRVETDDE